MKKIMLCFLSVLSLSACNPIENKPDQKMDTIMDIQTLVQDYVNDSGAVGAAVGFINNGEMQFFTYGKKAIHGDELITEDTVFEIGSITKVFTTLALADMASRGELQLDDPVEKYLPNVKVPEAGGTKITFRHLATHTSSIPRMPNNFNPKNPNNPYLDYMAGDMFNYLNQLTLSRVPGESFEYSNTGMGLLGQILMMKSGKSYEALIQNLISESLGMKNTVITLTPDIRQNLARAHHLQQEVDYWDFTGLVATGAVRSNIKDMTCFLAANMGLSSSPIVKLLQECHQKQFSPSPEFSVGLGWIVMKSNDAEIIMHNGGTAGSRSYLGFNPKIQRGVVILSNSSEDWPDELGLILLDPDFKRPFIDKNLASNPDYLNKFAGSYEATISQDLPKQELQITVYGKLLASSLSGGEVGVLYPESIGIFGVKGFPNGKVHFSLDEEGKVSKIQALLNNGTLLWEAIPKLQE